MKVFKSGIISGIMVSIGGCVYLACENKYIGAMLFPIALIAISYMGTFLYTGRIGFFLEEKDIKSLFLGLLGNITGVVIFGLLMRYYQPAFAEKAADICAKKLTYSFDKAVFLGIMCGILMYVAVKTFKESKGVIGIIFAIPVFILSGFEHSIADVFYFAISGIFNVNSILFIIAVIIGNSIGGLLFPILNTNK